MNTEYKKPTVVSPGVTPEPVEAGCCLTSCGGSPAGMQSGRHLNQKAGETTKILDKACVKTDETQEEG